MKLLEHEAKTILGRYGIATPRSALLLPGSPVPAPPVVLKSQVHTGGRGKAGGVRVVADSKAAPTAMGELFALEIKGELPTSLLAEELLDISREYYFSIVINRELSAIQLLAHTDGGIEVENNSGTSFFRLTLSPDALPKSGQKLADFLKIPDQKTALQTLIEHCLECFTKEDVTLLEINPLVLTADDILIAADCKMELDDTAAFRHPDWDFLQAPADANFVALDSEGTIATVANGAGLAMATVDGVKAAGFSPANFLDIGGAATPESIARSFTRILNNPHVTHIVINIFGGIVRCDIVAQAILEAKTTFDSLPTLIVRLSGTNADTARELLAAEHMQLYDDLPSALEAIS